MLQHRLILILLPLAMMLGIGVMAAQAQTADQGTANHISARELYRLCSSSSDVDYGMCAGYVTALADLLLNESVAGYKACSFNAVRPQEVMDIVKNFIDKNPDMNDRPAHITTAAALARAFPCP